MNRSNRSGFVCAIVLATASLASGPGASVDDPSEDRSPTCGTFALFNLIRMSGRNCLLREVLTALPGQDKRGHSLDELREAATRLGLSVDGIRLLEEGSLDRPMIVFLERQGHGYFVAIRPVGHTGRRVQILDGLADPTVIDLQDLTREPGWTGLGLIPRQPRWVALAYWTIASSLVLAGLVGVAAIVKRSTNPFRESFPN